MDYLKSLVFGVLALVALGAFVGITHSSLRGAAVMTAAMLRIEPNPCMLENGACAVAVTWSSPRQLSDYNQVWVSMDERQEMLFSCHEAGRIRSSLVPWIGPEHFTFRLYTADSCEVADRGSLLVIQSVTGK